MTEIAILTDQSTKTVYSRKYIHIEIKIGKNSADWEELFYSKLEFQNTSRIWLEKSTDWSLNEEKPQILTSKKLIIMDSPRNEESDHE